MENMFSGCDPGRRTELITSGEISPRQLEMLRLYICGMSYSEIAKEMNCTTSGSTLELSGNDCKSRIQL